MPLAFHADHALAAAAWNRCIDINFKGVMHGIMAAHDPMINQGRGHIVNLSSIYSNFPVVGAGVYGATKAAVNFLVRLIARGIPRQNQGDGRQTHGGSSDRTGRRHHQSGSGDRHPRPERARAICS